jgi:anti-sigma B factor antagonist
MLVTGGPAEAFENRLQDLLKTEARLVVDLSRVQYLDSAGVRALVRAHTTAERLGGRIALVGPGHRVARVLQISRLDAVFHIYDSVEAATASAVQSRH